MNKFTYLLFISILLLSCTDSENEMSTETLTFPSNLSLSTQTANIGETITINGIGFISNEIYSITFSQNVDGIIETIQSNSIQVSVPDNASSGNVTLTFNGETETIGFLNINASTQEQVYLYRSDFSNNPTSQEITLLNPVDGSEQFLTSIPLASTDAFDFIYNQTTNELIGIDQDDDELIKIDLINNQVSTIQFTNQNIDYHQLISDNIGNIYLYRSNFGNNPTTQEITILNATDGSEQFLTAIPLASSDAFNFIFNEPTNELIGIDQDDDELIKVDLNTNQVSTILFTNQNIDYHQLVSDDSGNIYLYRSDFSNSPTSQEITSLNPIDGSEQLLLSIPLASTDAFDFIYYETTNELIGIDQDDDELIKVDLNTNQVSTIPFTNQNIDYHQLVRAK